MGLVEVRILASDGSKGSERILHCTESDLRADAAQALIGRIQLAALAALAEVLQPAAPATSTDQRLLTAARHSPILRRLHPDALAQTLTAARRLTLRRGDTLFRQGDPPDGFYLVEAGRIAVQTSTPNGRLLTLALSGAGALVGEIGALDGQPRTAGIVAVDPCVVWHIPGGAVHLALADIGACRDAITLLCERLRHATDQQESGLLPLRQRLARVLLSLHLAAKGAPLTVSQDLLASMVAASRESTNGELRSLSRRRVILVGRKRISILDPAALANTAVMPIE